MPCGSLKGGGIAPAVVVEGEEVTAFIVGTAVHVLGGFDTVVIDVCGGVTDRDTAIASVADILLHVSCNSLDVGSGVGGWDVVDEFVAGEEQKSVVILLELVDCGEDVLEIDMVVGLGGFVTSDGVFGGVDVEGQVDAGGSKLVHAFIVVLAVIDGVHADGIDVEFLESSGLDQRWLKGQCRGDSLGNVPLTNGGISHGIGGI